MNYLIRAEIGNNKLSNNKQHLWKSWYKQSTLVKNFLKPNHLRHNGLKTTPSQESQLYL